MIPTLHGRIYDNVLDTVGATPMIRLRKLEERRKCHAQIIGKCESVNPLSSVKDRIGFAMVEEAEKQGIVTPNKTTLIEPTSGNTGIALAFVAAAKGYRLILTMPESMSVERRKMLALLGAETRLTPAAEGMKGAIREAEMLLSEMPNAHMLQQFNNPANPEIHRRTTAEEIWHDTQGQIDVFISGVGTGGTLTGVSEVLKPRKRELYVVAVEPKDSPVLSGGMPGAHKIQGIGAGFIPQILNQDMIDEIVCVSNEEAVACSREAALVQGLAVGISSGAALCAAFAIGKREEMKDKTIVVILPSFAERYLSTVLFEGLS